MGSKELFKHNNVESDCKNAIILNIESGTIYGPTLAPRGFGLIQEITTQQKSNKTSFEKEHNSSWYLLNIKQNGEMIFDVIPQDSSDDYDFLLFKYESPLFCDLLLGKKAQPIRSNLSHNSLKNKGVTGLSLEAKNNFIGQGVGNPYSKSLRVKSGEQYMLVLDNYTPNGKGYTLIFSYQTQIELKGIVVNSDSIPVKAEITLMDKQGNEISKTISDINGKYKIKANISDKESYNLLFTNDSSFISTLLIDSKSIHDNKLTDIHTVLPKLKAGRKYKLGSINFYPESTELLPQSYPSIEALYFLMKKNKKLKIQIEGHVHATGGENIKNDDIDALSTGRAKVIYDYLLNKGITGERITYIGLGASQMIYPKAINQYQESMNRRVEIKIVSLN